MTAGGEQPVSHMFESEEHAVSGTNSTLDDRGPGQPRSLEELALDKQAVEDAAEHAKSIAGRVTNVVAEAGKAIGLSPPGPAEPFKPEHRDLNEGERRGLVVLAGITIGGFLLGGLGRRKKEAKASSAH